MSGWGRGKRRIERLHGGMGMLLQSLRTGASESGPPESTSCDTEQEIDSDPSKRVKSELLEDGCQEDSSTSAGTSSQSLNEPGLPAGNASPSTQPTHPSDSGEIISDVPRGATQVSILEPTESQVSQLETVPDIPSYYFDKPPHEIMKWDAPEPNGMKGLSKKIGVNRRNNYFKGCKWSPDGSLLVTNSEDRKLRFFNLSNNQGGTKEELILSNTVQEGDLVYDFAWYPGERSVGTDLMVATTARGQPVLLRNARSGENMATYRPHNHLVSSLFFTTQPGPGPNTSRVQDELSSAHSLCFNAKGDRLFLGFNKLIKIFDSNRPGQQCTTVNTTSKLLGGQTGIISCLATSPDGNTFVAGSYGRTIGVYNEGVGDVVMAFQAHTGGITSITYSADGRYIFSGGRKDPEIRCWDTRNVTDLLCVYERAVATNQRIYFDIDRSHKWLVSGTSEGEVRVWDLEKLPQTPSDYGMSVTSNLSFRANNSCVNGISLHPTKPLVATASGQRVFPCPVLGSGSEDSSPEDYERSVSKISDLDNSLKLWSALEEISE